MLLPQCDEDDSASSVDEDNELDDDDGDGDGDGDDDSLAAKTRALTAFIARRGADGAAAWAALTLAERTLQLAAVERALARPPT